MMCVGSVIQSFTTCKEVPQPRACISSGVCIDDVDDRPEPMLTRAADPFITDEAFAAEYSALARCAAADLGGDRMVGVFSWPPSEYDAGEAPSGSPKMEARAPA